MRICTLYAGVFPVIFTINQFLKGYVTYIPSSPLLTLLVGSLTLHMHGVMRIAVLCICKKCQAYAEIIPITRK